jgi:uridine kinase
VYATKVHDMATDRLEAGLTAIAPEDAIVVFDCTFIQRGTLREQWDEVIYLDVSREIAVERGAARDAAMFGGIEGARRAYDLRYMAACDIYIREERPATRASILVEHGDLRRPRLIRGLGPSSPQWRR